VPWTVAAAFALGTFWFGSRYYVARTEAMQLETQRELAAVALKVAETRLEAERIATARLAADLTKLEAASKPRTADFHQAQDDLAGLKIVTLAATPGTSPRALAVAVWDPAQQQGVFTVDRLAANTADQRYELWMIDQNPVSAGVFTVGPDGRAKVHFKPIHQVQTAAKFAVSREKNDGLRSHAAPGEVVMISE
jgi:hypothetical protein